MEPTRPGAITPVYGVQQRSAKRPQVSTSDQKPPATVLQNFEATKEIVVEKNIDSSSAVDEGKIVNLTGEISNSFQQNLGIDKACQTDRSKHRSKHCRLS